MHALTAAIRLTGQLGLRQRSTDQRGATAASAEVAAREVIADDPAHHVIDPDSVLGLDTESASELDSAISAATVLTAAPWALALPRPGDPSVLRGPAALTAAAIEAGAAVIAGDGLCAFVPLVVGPAVQWVVYPAESPAEPPGRYETDRRLKETILLAASVLAEIGGAGGDRPETPAGLLPRGYESRDRIAADRATGLLLAAELGLADSPHAWSSHAVEVRSRELRALRDAAAASLTAIIWQAQR